MPKPTSRYPSHYTKCAPLAHVDYAMRFFNRKKVFMKLQKGLVLRRFVLRRFTFTTLVQSGRALPTCGASLSQLKRPFSTQGASSSFPMCLCFFLFYFSAVLISWLWFFHPRRPSKRQKRKNQNNWRYILSWCLLNHGLGLLQQNKKWFDWYFFQLPFFI
jgi:hypothetical protein